MELQDQTLRAAKKRVSENLTDSEFAASEMRHSKERSDYEMLTAARREPRKDSNLGLKQ